MGASHATARAAGGERDGFSDCAFLCDRVPPDHLVLRHTGATPTLEALDPSQISVLSWNIYKQRKPSFAVEFARLTADRDLVLLSELALDETTDARLSGTLPSEWAALDWNFAASFWMKKDVPTGVAIGATARAETVDFRRTEDLEPFVKSPKATVITTYALRGRSDSLMVLSIHGINFRGNDGLTRQINQLAPLIAQHKGPVIFAGDFNTKNSTRVAQLGQQLAALGLRSVRWENPLRGKQLDGAYVRGLRESRARLVQSPGSDHPALDLIFSVEP